MPINLRDLIAGLAAGASTEGAVLNKRKDQKEQDQRDEAKSARALQQLLAGKNFDLEHEPQQSREVDDNEWNAVHPESPRKKIVQFDRTRQAWVDAPVLDGSDAGPTAPPPIPAGLATPRRLGTIVPEDTAPALPTAPVQQQQAVTPPTQAVTAQPPVKRTLSVTPKTTAQRTQLVRNEQGVFEPVDAATGLSIRTGKPVKDYVAPTKPETVEVAHPDGSKTLETKAPGMQTAPATEAKQTPALMIATMNRLGLSEGDISAAIEQMDKAENDPEFRKQLTVWNKMKSAAATTKQDEHATGATGVINNMLGAGVSGAAQQSLRDFPALSTYLRNKEVVGTAATEILPRPNQQLLQIEKGLSGIDINWNPDLITDVQSRRHRMRDMLHASLQATPLGAATTGKKLGGNAGSPSSGSPLQQAWDAAKAKYGEAETIKQIGPRPPK